MILVSPDTKLSLKMKSTNLQGNADMIAMLRAWAIGFCCLLTLPMGSVASAQTIAGRAASGFHQFVVDGKPFVPLGVNVLVQGTGGSYQSFDMFDVRSFDAAQMDANFAAVRTSGYNFVRLWLKGYDPDAGFGLSTPDVGQAYVDNVFRALQLARKHELRVVLTGAFKTGLWLPANYIPKELPPESEVGGMNRLLLLPQMATATGKFYGDLLRSLQARDPSILDTLLYFDLYNELHFDLARPPLNRTSGTYISGQNTYDLSDATSRQKMMDDAAFAWIKTVSSSVKQVRPNLPVTASSFLVVAFGHLGFDGGRHDPKDTRASPYPLRPDILLAGGGTVMDVHIYSSPAHDTTPGFHARAMSALEASGFNQELARHAPIIFGEFGSGDLTFKRPDTAIPEMSETWSALCPLHTSGYALWALIGDVATQGPGTTALLHSFPSSVKSCSIPN